MLYGKMIDQHISINMVFGLLYFTGAVLEANLVLSFKIKKHENITFLLADA
jgi:hypothetical protein